MDTVLFLSYNLFFIEGYLQKKNEKAGFILHRSGTEAPYLENLCQSVIIAE